jgi:hypothetical protein
MKSSAERKVLFALISSLSILPALPAVAQTTTGGGLTSIQSGSSASPGTSAIPHAPTAFPSVSQKGLGARQVPSMSNAEPSSPALRQTAPLRSQPPPVSVTDPAVSGREMTTDDQVGTRARERGMLGDGLTPRSTQSPTGREGRETPSSATSEPASPANSETSGPANTNPYASKDALRLGQPNPSGRRAGELIAPVPTPSNGGAGVRYGSNAAAVSKTVGDCMNDWDGATHMTKVDWLKTCERVTIDDPKTR